MTSFMNTTYNNLSNYKFRSLLLSRFFTKGWGKPEHLKRIFELRRQLGKRSVALTFVDREHPVTITRQEIKSDHKILEGYFTSPFAQYLPDLLPEESVKAHFQVVLPTKWPTSNYRPMCIQYAGTGRFVINIIKCFAKKILNTGNAWCK